MGIKPVKKSHQALDLFLTTIFGEEDSRCGLRPYNWASINRLSGYTPGFIPGLHLICCCFFIKSVFGWAHRVSYLDHAYVELLNISNYSNYSILKLFKLFKLCNSSNYFERLIICVYFVVSTTPPLRSSSPIVSEPSPVHSPGWPLSTLASLFRNLRRFFLSDLAATNFPVG